MQNNKQAIIVCLGDSITQGISSFNYVDLLSKDATLGNVTTVNQGVGGDLAYNVLRRIDKAIALKPSFISILIGTNDVIAGVNKTQALWIKISKQIQQKPTKESFKHNLEAIIEVLKQKTKARIALLSLPLIGNDTQNKYNKAIQMYTEIIKSIALQNKIDYLPLMEKQMQYLKKNSNKTGNENLLLWLFMARALVEHVIFQRSFDTIAKKHGFLLTTDCVHQNSRGGQMIAQLIIEWIIKKS